MKVTSQEDFFDGITKITIEHSDLPTGYNFRMIVNGEASPWTGFYQGILCWRSYGYCTQYWGSPNHGEHNRPPVERVFKITPMLTSRDLI